LMSPVLEATLKDIDSATQGMTDEQLAWHPPEKWSTGDILEHLSLAFGGTIKAMQIALEKNSARKREPTLKERLRVLVVVELGRFPRGRKSPEIVKPQGIPPREALNSIRRNLIAMDDLLTACEKRFGAGTKLSAHPIFGPITARQWRRFHTVHTRHHMRQVRALREQIEQAQLEMTAAS
jgi:hypothetical protein